MAVTRPRNGATKRMSGLGGKGALGSFSCSCTAASSAASEANALPYGFGYCGDPWFIDEFDLPIIPIDLYDLANTDRKLEILGKTVEVSDRILGMDCHLQPVPMGRPVPARPGHGKPYRKKHKHWLSEIFD